MRMILFMACLLWWPASSLRAQENQICSITGFKSEADKEKFVKEHFKFPIGSKAGEKASVIVDMTIDTLGVVSDFSIRTSIDPKTDRAILNMCAFLPVFQPVVCNGRKTKTAIALLFTLKRYY